jgi:isoleucyl-tRNA synthetase
MTKANLYPPVESNPSFPAIEREVLEIWKRDHVFEASVCNRPQLVDGKSNEFIFYDGPPFANGLPHYGHLVTGFVKDLIPRYQTMKGRHVERRFGWDCHGLPAELEVEKELGVAGRNAILDYGIANFNAKCRESVQRYTKEWEWYVSREARWASFENDYKTMDITFMESVMWAFKTLWDKGLVYEGYRVVPYSWTVQTPLSNFETRLDNSYRERLDPALTVGFVLEAMSGEPFETKLLAWTTTPWTLPSNMALCVNAVLDYAVFDGDGKERWILAAESVERYERELKGFTRVSTIKGTELIGRRYAPLFPYFKDTANAFRVISGAFVSTSDGTGVVHIAPGFGEDDFEVSRVEGIPLVVPVDAAGKFTSEISDYVGQNVILEANANIIKDLKARGGVVVRHDQYRHNYPHCWRTDQPLIYKAVESWYVKVSSFRDRMVDLNKKINWTPEHVKEGIFGNWLANARDWNVSRNRFWGTPIPVWKSDDPRYPRVDVYGSLDELERDFGVRPGDLHRPMIDDLVRPNPDDPTGKSTMRRVPDVLDCWFESGSMPFAQLHYPFENKERFEANFPGDFIVEYVAQTRGWFYTMMVLSTALFDRAPFKNCVCHGVVLDEKLSETFEEAEKLSRSGRGIRHARRGCTALVHAVVTAHGGRRSGDA